ncbi:Vacuolar protein sorting-associated protein 29, partial [Fasciola gigantica]
LVLVIGDFHIPERKHSIHPAFKTLLAPGKIQHILCTGNLTTKCTYDYLKLICGDVHVVKGEFDEVCLLVFLLINIGLGIPPHEGPQCREFQNRFDKWLSSGSMGKQRKPFYASKTTGRRYSYLRPYTSIRSLRIWWQVFHKPRLCHWCVQSYTQAIFPRYCYSFNRLLLLLHRLHSHRFTLGQPARSLITTISLIVCRNPQPSFVLLDIQESVIQLYVYTLVDDEHKVSRIEYRKPIAA